MFRISIQMLRIPFEGLEFAFERFESLSNGSNFDSNASNPFRMVGICTRMLRIPFEWFECFESLSSGLNFDSNASNSFRMVRIYIQIL